MNFPPICHQVYIQPFHIARCQICSLIYSICPQSPSATFLILFYKEWITMRLIRVPITELMHEQRNRYTRMGIALIGEVLRRIGKDILLGRRPELIYEFLMMIRIRSDMWREVMIYETSYKRNLNGFNGQLIYF
uniref:Transcription factor n=1 Tax=Caenorhabditis tropicalis TaxID=1561998 RepID=A0A1I7TL32_9PELO